MVINARVVTDNGDGENKSGLAIEVDGKEISRVATVRRFGANPYTQFADQVDIEIQKAKKIVKTIEELYAEAGKLQ